MKFWMTCSYDQVARKASSLTATCLVLQQLARKAYGSPAFVTPSSYATLSLSFIHRISFPPPTSSLLTFPCPFFLDVGLIW